MARFGKRTAYDPVKKSRQAGGIFGSRKKTPAPTPSANMRPVAGKTDTFEKTYPDGQVRVFSRGRKTGQAGLSLIGKGSKTQGSFASTKANKATGSKAVARSNTRTTPARPPQSAGATTTSPAPQSSTKVLNQQTSRSAPSDRSVRDVIIGAASAAAGGAAGAAGLAIRDRFRNRVRATAGSVVRRVAAEVLPPGPVPKQLSPGNVIHLGPGSGKGAETERVGRIKPRNAAASAPQSPQTPPKPVVVERAQGLPKQNRRISPPGTTAQQEGSNQSAGAGSKPPKQNAPQPAQSGRNFTVKKNPDGSWSLTPKDAAQEAGQPGRINRPAEVTNVDPAKEPRRISRPQGETKPPKPPKPTPQPDVNAPARANESPSHAGNDETVAPDKEAKKIRRQQMREIARLRKANEKLKGEVGQPAQSGRTAEQMKILEDLQKENAELKAQQEPQGGKEQRRISPRDEGTPEKKQGSRPPLRKQTGPTGGRGAKANRAPLPTRATPAPPEASVSPERMAREIASAKAEQESAGKRNRPGRPRVTPPKPSTPEVVAEGPSDAELRQIEAAEKAPAAEKPRVKKTPPAPKPRVRTIGNEVIEQGYSSALGKDADKAAQIKTRQQMIEKAMAEKGYTKIEGMGDEAKATRVEPQEQKTSAPKARTTKVRTSGTAKAPKARTGKVRKPGTRTVEVKTPQTAKGAMQKAFEDAAAKKAAKDAKAAQKPAAAPTPENAANTPKPKRIRARVPSSAKALVGGTLGGVLSAGIVAERAAAAPEGQRGKAAARGAAEVAGISAAGAAIGKAAPSLMRFAGPAGAVIGAGMGAYNIGRLGKAAWGAFQAKRHKEKTEAYAKEKYGTVEAATRTRKARERAKRRKGNTSGNMNANVLLNQTDV